MKIREFIESLKKGEFDTEKFCKEVREGKWDAQRDAVVRREQKRMKFYYFKNMGTIPGGDDDG